MIKKKNNQKELFEVELVEIIDLEHPLCLLSKEFDWKTIDEKFHPLYSYFKGRPAKEVRLMVGLQYLKATYKESDESVVEKWVENPYWQYFCGEIYFQKKCPINPTMMTKFRNRAKKENIEELLNEVIKTGLLIKIIKPESFEKINVDTTVQEKNITFPTDAKLYYKMLCKLVIWAKKNNIILRQSYLQKGKSALLMQSRYSHAKQMKRANKTIKTLKNYLGRVYRDIDRKKVISAEFSYIVLEYYMKIADRLLKQKKDDKNKIYSIHELDVYCISKGKSHKRYEFGCKSSFATTMKENFIVGCFSLEKNVYDGHTLSDQINQVEKLTKKKVKEVNVDLGYRGHDYKGAATINIVGRQKIKDRKKKKTIRRRAAIEPIIGHTKSDGHLGRNYLKGIYGDYVNTVMSGCGQNIRKMLKYLKKKSKEKLRSLFYFLEFLFFMQKERLFQG
jgi:transposase, IS5 family